MKKTKINVNKIIAELDKTHQELREGIPKAKLTKEDAKEITAQLEEVIALAESIKAENARDKAQRA